MKRVSIACFALAVLVAAAAVFSPLHAAETSKEGSLSVLKAWVGENPFAEKNGKKIWEVESFQKKLREVLGQKRHESFLKELVTGGATPVKQENNLLFLFFCKSYDCMGFQTVIFVNLDTNRVSACWKDAQYDYDLWLSENRDEKKIEYATCSQPYRSEIYFQNELKK